METKEVKIEIPEGYEIDKENSTFEKIVFKKKDNKPRSWEEYLRKDNHPNKLWFINPANKITNGISSTGGAIKNCDLNKSHCYMGAYLPSKELAESFLAMMQLMSLRQAWIGDWKPDWYVNEYKYCIIILDNKYTVDGFIHFHQSLSFPTRELAENFMNTFKDLLEIAKPLI